MIDYLASLTSLPNLHPALVHFPIALVFSAIVVEVGSLLWRRQVWLERTAALLCGFAWLSAGAAYLAGRSAADSVGGIPARAEGVLADHADYALWALIVITLSTILRVTSSARDRKLAVSRFGALRSVGVLALLVAAALIACTADLGGSLVYLHGVAVTSSGQKNGAEQNLVVVNEIHSSGKTHPVKKTADGSLIWQPNAGDESPLGAILHPAKNGTFESIRVAELSGEEPRIRFEVSGFVVLCFPETFGDVAIEAAVDLSEFEGSFGLGHHIQSVEDGVYFSINSTMLATLTRRGGSDAKEFDRELVSDRLGVATLSTSVAGSHLKGQINGEVVVHGHGPSGEAGRVGILVDGRGVIGIDRIIVTPLSDGKRTS